jgi:hypothetical protein
LVGDDGLFDLNVDVLLRPVGGGNESVETGEVEQETDQPNTARADLDTDEREGQYEPMEKCQSRTTLKKLGYLRADIEGLMPGLPSLKRRSGHVKLLGRLTLRDTLCLEVEIMLEQVGPLKPVPELVAVNRVMVCKIDYSAHGYLSLEAIVYCSIMMAKNGEVAR